MISRPFPMCSGVCMRPSIYEMYGRLPLSLSLTDDPRPPSPLADRRPISSLFRPSRLSPEHGLAVLLLGFGLEAGTEVYQFLERGSLTQGPIAYYATLATTILGFYLIYLGMREWHGFYPKLAPKHTIQRRRRVPWTGLAVWGGGTAMTAVLEGLLVGNGAAPAPFWVVWPVGGLIVLAFASFFFGLRQEASRAGSWWGNALGWGGFTWSLGVATYSGLLV